MRGNWFSWLMIALQAFSALAQIARIGKADTPTSPRQAAMITAVHAAIIIGIYHYWI